MISQFHILIALLVFIPLLCWAPSHGLLPDQILWLIPAVSIGLFAAQFLSASRNNRPVKTFGTTVLFVFLAITVLSATWNGQGPVTVILSLRMFVPSYLLFLALINMGLNEQKQRTLVKVVFVIFLLQIPLAPIKWVTIGQGEALLGLIGSSKTTFITLFGIAFVTAYYIAYRPSVSYLLYGLGFIGVTIAGGKRGPIFLMPLVIATEMWSLRKQAGKLFRIVLFVLMLSPVAFYVVLRCLPSLNPEDAVWGEFDPEFAFNYALGDLDGRAAASRMAASRGTATKDIVGALWRDGPETFLLGRGPGCILKSRFGVGRSEEERTQTANVEYGLNGINWLALQYGFAGLVTWYLLYAMIWYLAFVCYRRESEPFWKAFALGMVGCGAVTVPISLYYSPMYKSEFSTFFFCMAGVLHYRYELLKGAHGARVWRRMSRQESPGRT